MAYALTQDGTILVNNGTNILKAADETGKYVLGEILKSLRGLPADVLPLKYDKDQQVWLNTKDKYVLFDLTGDNSSDKAVLVYLEAFSEVDLPAKDTELVNVSGSALATDSGIILATTQGNTLDIPMQAQSKEAKIKRADALKAQETIVDPVSAGYAPNKVQTDFN